MRSDVTEWFKNTLPKIKTVATGFGIYSKKYSRLFGTLKFENAGLVSKNCPSPPCKNTVTLCGVCINVTELGNIAFGYAAHENRGVMLWGGFYAEVKNGRGWDKVSEVASALAGFQYRFGGDLCEILKSAHRNPYNIDLFRSSVRSSVEANNNAYWAASFGTNILAQWDTKHSAALGDWWTFLVSAFSAIGQTDALTLNTENRCSPCAEKPTAAAEFLVGIDGSTWWF